MAGRWCAPTGALGHLQPRAACLERAGRDVARTGDRCEGPPAHAIRGKAVRAVAGRSLESLVARLLSRGSIAKAPEPTASCVMRLYKTDGAEDAPYPSDA